MRRMPEHAPFAPRGEIECLAQLLRERAERVDHRGLAEDDDDGEDARTAGPSLILRLSAEDLRRLDQESEATRFTRARWVVALIQRTLHGKPQFNRADRIDLSKIAKALQQIDARLTKSARSLEDLLSNTALLTRRLGEVEEMRDQVKSLAGALDQAFQGNEAYWQAAADNGAPTAPTDIRLYAKRKS